MKPERWRQVESLYHSMLALPAHTRPAALAAACADDAALQADVASLLDHATGSELVHALGGTADPAAPGPPTTFTGRTIDAFEVQDLLGAGGMGEVYRARDTRLGRDVAIKILPREFRDDADRVARFEREARLLASLNHPHIGAVYGLVGTGDVTALVMELVDGDDLAQRLGGGAVPVAEALALARQIAEAVAAAHERGIIHRDLKPANIKVRPDGTVKVLDFGLAKALASHDEARRLSPSPTIKTPATTHAGVILGTAAYMSPEQARAAPVDKRADIWAFGCVLYEMLAGARAFPGDTVTETLAAVLRQEPEWSRLPPEVHAPIRVVLRRCLEKDPRARLADMSAVLVLIEELPSLVMPASSGQPFAREQVELSAVARHQHLTQLRRRRVAREWAVALALAAVVGTGVWFARSPPTPAGVLPVRFDVHRVQAPPLDASSRHLALSPDGSRLIYATATSLRIRSLDRDDVPLPVLGREPFFSPDGQWVAFFSGTGLQRMPVNGGALETITDEISGTERTFGGSWAPDGTIVVASGGALLRVSAAGGTTEVVAAPDRTAGEVRYAWPEFLPDGRSVLFTIVRDGGSAEARVSVIDVPTRQQKPVLEGGHAARYASSGHLLYVSGGRLQAVAFDAQRIATRGVPITVNGVVIAETAGGYNAGFDVSSNGTLAYLGPTAPRLRTMAWVDRDGREESIAAAPMEYIYPRISPDGTRVALDVGGRNRDIWMWHFERGRITPITEGPTEDLMPAWSPDGARVFFGSDRAGGPFRVFSVAADGAGAEQQEFAGADGNLPLSMPAPGELLVYATGPGTREGDVAVVTIGPDAQVRTLFGKKGVQTQAQVSPDRRWITYQSEESGSSEVYVRSYPDVDRRREQISHGGGVQPLWGKAGSGELFYWDLKGRLKVVSLTLTPDLGVGATRDVPLGDGYVRGIQGQSWAYQVSPLDGRLLLLREVPGNQTLAPIKVVVNWFEELRRLVPTR